MLNPAQVSALRAQVETDPLVSEVSGFHIKRMEVLVGGNPSGAIILKHEEGSSAEMRAPRSIFGCPLDASCLSGVESHRVTEPEHTAWRLTNVTVIGNNALLYDNQLFISTPLITYEQHKKIDFENNYNHQGFVLTIDAQSGNKFAYFASARQANSFPGLGIFFANLEPNNYGSFLFRVLPQMLFLMDMEVHFDFYVTSGRTSWFLEALRLARLPVRPVFSVSDVIGDHFDNLVTFSDFSSEGWFDKKTRARLAEFIAVVASTNDHEGSFGERLYVSRLLGGGARPHYRRLINEKSLVRLARSQGFKIVFPETLSLAEQISVFSRAKLVVGPSGSGMLNAIFSPPGTEVVDMESYHNTVRQHARIYSSTGKNYSFLFGSIEKRSPRLAFSDWIVDETLFETCLSEVT